MRRCVWPNTRCEGRRRRLQIQARRPHRQEAKVHELRHETNGRAVGARRVEDRKRKACAGKPVETAPSRRRRSDFEWLRDDCVGGVRGFTPFAPPRQRGLRIKVERDYFSPAPAAATASDAASVVFPAPPFCVSNATARISIYVTSDTVLRSHKTPIAKSCGAKMLVEKLMGFRRVSRNLFAEKTAHRRPRRPRIAASR